MGQPGHVRASPGRPAKRPPGRSAEKAREALWSAPLRLQDGGGRREGEGERTHGAKNQPNSNQVPVNIQAKASSAFPFFFSSDPALRPFPP